MTEEVTTTIVECSCDLSTIESLLMNTNELLASIYAVSLFVVGVSAAVLVVYLLYRFLKIFY